MRLVWNTEGLGTAAEAGGHLLVVGVALTAGVSSYRAALARR